MSDIALQLLQVNPDARYPELFGVDATQQLWVASQPKTSPVPPPVSVQAGSASSVASTETLSRLNYHPQLPSPIQSFVLNETGQLLALSFTGGIALIQISRRIRDELIAAKAEIMCSTLLVDLEFFSTHPTISIHRVQWNGSLLFVLTDGGLRIYDMKKTYLVPQAHYPSPQLFKAIDLAVINEHAWYLLTSDGEI